MDQETTAQRQRAMAAVGCHADDIQHGTKNSDPDTPLSTRHTWVAGVVSCQPNPLPSREYRGDAR
ncbi:MAG TPA: hypothetical protein PLN56_01845 [Methanoregulaceae archaeon]|nr:MAG: hypothetical protein IPI71_02580 [Methanolinea sp.]HON80962.1 hypothetical protein [Methanoregulaceae archaeon]HPD09731.1 hypothetical protein [Methanoregulaceae archaeon]HRT14548.1 hypothetical protein [Methanoregulaceae archaeon]HRU30119.1 hypothetical protein [Methanoregulaceae archaeon]